LVADIDAHMVARKASDRAKKAAEQTTGDVLPSDGSVNQHNPLGRVAKLATLPRKDRAIANGTSESNQKKLDRLVRDFPTLAADVRAGRLSVNRAAIEAGFVKLLDIILCLKTYAPCKY
jgi:hypothetical protein